MHEASAFRGMQEATDVCRKYLDTSTDLQTLGGSIIGTKAMSAFSEFHKVGKLEFGGSQGSSPQPQLVEPWRGLLESHGSGSQIARWVLENGKAAVGLRRVEESQEPMLQVSSQLRLPSTSRSPAEPSRVCT